MIKGQTNYTIYNCIYICISTLLQGHVADAGGRYVSNVVWFFNKSVWSVTALNFLTH